MGSLLPRGRGPVRDGAKALACLVLVAASLAGAVPDASAGTTGYNRHGTFLVNGQRAFPIGLSMPPPLTGRTPRGAPGIDELTAGGITLFATGPHGTPWTPEVLDETRAWADAAAARGVHTWVNLRELAASVESTPERDMLGEVVTALRDSPGLAMWKGLDEASAFRLPEDVLEPYELVKALDPDHLFHTIHAPLSKDGTIFRHPPRPPNLRPWNTVTDTHGVNVYPIYHHLVGVREPKLAYVGLWTAAIARATESTAITTTLQICFSGSDARDGSGAYVLPTRRQERFMIYDAILSGARGLFFFGGHHRFCLNPRDRELGWNWTFWNRTLRELVAEIRSGSPLHAVLLRPETKVRLRTSDRRTRAVSRRAPGELWVLATRRGPASARVTMRGLPSWARVGRTYPGGARVRAKEGRLTLPFAGWGVRIVRFAR
jgi:hypothetical protein